MPELWERDAWELADGVRSGELRSVDLLEHFFTKTRWRRTFRLIHGYPVH